MRILNAYAGIGGNRKLWGSEHEIVAVEYDLKTANVYSAYFPNDEVIVTDAHQYILNHYKEFDFIWCSPPCPTHSTLNLTKKNRDIKIEYPDMKLYQEIIFLQKWFKGLFLIENVIPYYTPLIPPTKKLHRHLYWANFKIGQFKVEDERKHNNIVGSEEVYGFDIKESNIKDKRKALRNMVDPKLGEYILNCAMNKHNEINPEQLKLKL